MVGITWEDLGGHRCPLLKKLRDSPAELYDEIITVKIEGTDRSFFVHKGLVCHYSEFFSGMMRTPMTEAFKSEVTLPKDNLVGFEAFFLWLYQGRLAKVSDPTALSWATLFDILGFADFRLIPTLSNAAVDVCMAKLRMPKRGQPWKQFGKVWDRFSPQHPVREMMVDMLLDNCFDSTIGEREAWSQLPYELTFMVLQKSSTQRRDVSKLLERNSYSKAEKGLKPKWHSSSSCPYHDHKMNGKEIKE